MKSLVALAMSLAAVPTAADVPTYRVEFLGAGGMGEVYRGVDSQSGESVAVKLLTTVRGSGYRWDGAQS